MPSSWAVLLAAAVAAEPQSVFVDPAALRVLRLPAIEAQDTPGGDQSPAVAAGLFLTLPGAALHLDRVDELRAPIPTAEARVYAGLVASAAPLAATLSAASVPLDVTTGLAAAPRCHHATMERFTLTLVATGTVLRGQRVVPGTESETTGACPARPAPSAP